MIEALSILFDEVKQQNPLVHHITNQVTINDCANVTLAIGGSPVMASSPKEVEEMTGIANALVLNIGTLSEQSVESMILSGIKANEKGIPVIFDPVGVGATTFRKQAAKEILEKVKISIIRGNASEVSALLNDEQKTKGVDAVDSISDVGEIAKKVAQHYSTVVVVTGAIDYVTDGKRMATVENGHPILTKVTGTGCMTTSMIGSFASVTKDPFQAAVVGVSVMGLAGEQAYNQLQSTTQYGMFKYHLVDCIGAMNQQIWEKGVNIQSD